MSAFSPEVIHAAVEEAFANAQILPDDKRGAVIAKADETGVHLMAVEKIGEHWQLTQYYAHGWTDEEPDTYGVTLTASW